MSKFIAFILEGRLVPFLNVLAIEAKDEDVAAARVDHYISRMSQVSPDNTYEVLKIEKAIEWDSTLQSSVMILYNIEDKLKEFAARPIPE